MLKIFTLFANLQLNLSYSRMIKKGKFAEISFFFSIHSKRLPNIFITEPFEFFSEMNNNNTSTLVSYSKNVI